ncbi:hypothetical protein QNM99_14155 [Pseudomonas sp. PCH446]
MSFETEALYGPDDLNRSITHSGSIAVRDNLRPGVSGFPSSGKNTMRVCAIGRSATPMPSSDRARYSLATRWMIRGG